VKVVLRPYLFDVESIIVFQSIVIDMLPVYLCWPYDGPMHHAHKSMRKGISKAENKTEPYRRFDINIPSGTEVLNQALGALGNTKLSALLPLFPLLLFCLLACGRSAGVAVASASSFSDSVSVSLKLLARLLCQGKFPSCGVPGLELEPEANLTGA
jgi:hypothetical protein